MIPDNGRMSGRLAVALGNGELFFAAYDQLGNEDTWWVSLICLLLPPSMKESIPIIHTSHFFKFD